MSLVIGTRGSALALAQARIATALLGEPVEVRVIRTAGDVTDRPLSELADGIFVSAIEQALLRSEIDVAVHSLKDVPTAEHDELVIAAIPEREDPRDVLVTRDRGGLPSLPAGAVVGTSSPRRAAFIRALAPGVRTRDIRGNVETRLRKVRDGEYDATLLALAGLRRLGIAVADVEILSLEQCPPAAGQGALAIQCRRADAAMRERLARIDHTPTRLAVTAERALLRELGASCTIPLGVCGRVDGAEIVLDAALAEPAGVVRASVRGRDPLEIAKQAAAELGVAIRA